jgi:hypothetical protein
MMASAPFPFPTSSQYFSFICDPFADPIIWTIIFSERRFVYFSVIETDTATSGLGWIFQAYIF